MIKKSILAFLAVFLALPLHAATNFPTSIDTYADKNASDVITSSGWNNMQDAIEALETKVGADSSADSTSLDYDMVAVETTLGAGIIPVTVVEKTDNYTIKTYEMNRVFQANKGSAIAITLPAASAVDAGSWLKIKNIGAGTCTITGTVNGGTNPTLLRYGEVLIYSDGSAWYGQHVIAPSTATPTANTPARWNSDAIMKSAELNMTGEASADSATNTATLNMGNVTSGDRIMVVAVSAITGTGLSVPFIQISKDSGTASIVFGHDALAALMPLTLSGTTAAAGSITTIVQVTGSGSLVLAALGEASGSPSTHDTEIYAVFLKKQ